MADALQNFIDGKWVDAQDGERFDVFNPATGAVIATQALRAGIVWINDTQPAPTEMPWGGYKQSGVGREFGKQGLGDYLEEKAVYLNLS